MELLKTLEDPTLRIVHKAASQMVNSYISIPELLKLFH
ncbi:unnamed protein product [Brugia timori]|uniref:Transcriptional regulator n=1 Tax=Brugia timori TaxID=42155 RepID=A0A0R3Q8E0_9BILA|nr:unnamed protein product [Brugia timori]